MTIRPFWFTDTIALSGSGTGTARITVSAGEKVKLRKLRFVATGAFSLTGMRDDSGQPFTNANVTDPITSTLLANAANGYNVIQEFNPPLELTGPNAINFDLLDTSAASNTVRIAIEGEKET